jgi:hypothetical protein
MFDLEKSIAEWRRQMLAVGIKTPVPLEELESHLREETERQTKSGLNEQKAFEDAIQQIGKANMLNNEFEKIAGAAGTKRMNSTMHNSLRRSYANEMLVGISVVFALIFYSVLRHPASVSQGGLLFFIASVGALLAYGGAALWARRSLSDSIQVALGHGARMGLLLGAAAILNISLEYFGSLDTPWKAVLGVGMWALMFLLFGATGSATYYRTESLPHAVIASVWCALVSVVAAVLYGFSVNLFFMPHLQQILEGDFTQSGMADSQAFVIQNTLNAASSHLFVAPSMAMFFGFAGGFACMMISSIRRSIAIGLGMLEFVLVGSGLESIHFALSLNRSDRGPFILGGLLTLGLALACAHPVLTAIRRRTATE